MDKINILEAFDNGDLVIRDLDEIDKDSFVVLPIMDLSSYGSEIVGQLSDIGLDIFNDILNGKIQQPKDLKKSITQNTMSHFGVQIKRKSKGSKGKKLKDIKSMELTEFAAFSAILMVINNKLGEIIAREKAIVDFLEVDKQTEMKANFLTLSTIVREYHHNFENEKFLQNRELQVLEIRRNAEHQILFYKEMADKKLKGFKKGIHIEVDKALNEIQGRLQYYRLGLYIYTYASFLDVVLLENFDKAFIDSIIEDINNHTTQYVDFYNESAEIVQHMAEGSGKSLGMKGASKITGAIGKLFGKMKAEKQATKLNDSSKAIKDKNDTSLVDMMEKFANNKEAGVDDIVENLIYLENLYNKDPAVIVDAEYLYIEKQ